MLKNLENADLNKAKFLNIDHKLKIEALLITSSSTACWPEAAAPKPCCAIEEFIASPYFKDGLHLICDGFDYDFRQISPQSGQEGNPGGHGAMKMDLSIGMMSAIKSLAPFNDLYLVAKTYLP
jgi:hypothetical protein